MKGSVITGERQKESLSANNYFWWEADRGSGWKGVGRGGVGGGTIEIKTFFPGELCVPYHVHILVTRGRGAAPIGRARALI